MIQPSTIRSACSRRGFVLFAVILILAIAAILFASLLKSGFGERFVVRSQQYAEQSAALAHSAVERTAARLRADASYTGETWRIPAASLDGRHDAVVEIAVEPRESGSDRRSVRVQADYPRDPKWRKRHTLEIEIASPQERNDP